MKREYLPSRNFLIRLAFILIILAIFFGVYYLVKYIKNKPSSKKPVTVLVKDVVQKDSNRNGIPDWEESLWGLDPLKNGPSNKEFIFEKRKTLAMTNGSMEDPSQLTSTDDLSREFFSIIMSLQQAGTLNEESINLVSNTIGEKIVTTPIPDAYTKNMLIIKPDSEANLTTYYNKFKALTEKYSDKNIGDELTFIAEGIRINDVTAMKTTQGVALAYKQFGKELLDIPVPQSLASTHLSLANNYEKTGQSIDGLTQILEEPLVGMKALLNYKKYSDALVYDINSLSSNL